MEESLRVALDDDKPADIPALMRKQRSSIRWFDVSMGKGPGA